MRKISFSRHLLTQLIFLLVGLFILIPVWSTFRLAFDGSLRGRPTEFTWLPKEFSVEAFTAVLDRPYQSV